MGNGLQNSTIVIKKLLKELELGKTVTINKERRNYYER